MQVVARKLPANELAGLREMFGSLDVDNSGTITVEELREGLRKKGATLAEQEVQKILDKIDINGNSRIDYEEFLAATMHLSKLNREENLLEAFKHFDKDNSGYITTSEIIVGVVVLAGQMRCCIDAQYSTVGVTRRRGTNKVFIPSCGMPCRMHCGRWVRIQTRVRSRASSTASTRTEMGRSTMRSFARCKCLR